MARTPREPVSLAQTLHAKRRAPITARRRPRTLDGPGGHLRSCVLAWRRRHPGVSRTTFTRDPLAGRVVAITGGARGIGRATAQACVRAGMQVAIGDVDIAAARRTASELGHGTLAVELDVTDRASMRHFFDVVEERLGSLDVLVNNAGIMHLGPLAEEPDDGTRRMVDINVHGVLHGMKEALPRMTARNSGHVVNIASTAGRAGFAGAATYSGTKHFVLGATEAVRTELHGTAVEVSCILPVLVNTELAAGASQARFVGMLEPHDVADAIMRTLRVPRFEVYVPRSMQILMTLTALLPRPARDAVARALRADRVFTKLDARARRGYEQRASRSEPGLHEVPRPPERGD